MLRGKIVFNTQKDNHLNVLLEKKYPQILRLTFNEEVFSEDIAHKLDNIFLTPLHLRIGIVYKKPLKYLEPNDFYNLDYLLYNSSITLPFCNSKTICWDSDDHLLEIITSLERGKEKEISQAGENPFCSVIISTYNSKNLLQLTLEAYTIQTYRNFEIIIADDGSTDGTEEMVKKYNRYYPIQFCWQEDRGFRKAEILNKALSIARGQYIIMTDHDAIPGPDFVKQHIEEHQEGVALLGGRRCIPKEHQDQLSIDRVLLNIDSLKKLATLQWFYQKKLRLVSLVDNPYFYALGVNISLHKKYFLEVSGYNQSLVGYGDEDIDLARRLHEHGLKFKGLLNSQLYHVEHPLNRNFFYIVKKGNNLQVKIKQVIKERGFSHKKCVLLWTTDKWRAGTIKYSNLVFDPQTFSFYGTLVLPSGAENILFKIQYITQYDEVVWNDNQGQGWSWDLKGDYCYKVMPDSVEERRDYGDVSVYIPAYVDPICF
jgi:glycosyltransferase involved in cell wall biosynthesis